MGSWSALRKFATRENRYGVVDSCKTEISRFKVSILSENFDLKFTDSIAFKVFVPRDKMDGPAIVG